MSGRMDAVWRAVQCEGLLEFFGRVRVRRVLREPLPHERHGARVKLRVPTRAAGRLGRGCACTSLSLRTRTTSAATAPALRGRAVARRQRPLTSRTGEAI